MAPDTLADGLQETLAVFDDPGVPLTTPEVTAQLNLGRRSTYNRLQRLAEHDRLETKKVGAGARVWWQPPTDATADTPTSAAADSSADRTSADQPPRGSHDQFEHFVDTVEEYAIFRLDTEGHVETWNSGAEQIKGYAAGEILGDHLSTFYTGSDRDAGVPEANLAEAAEQGSTEDEGWRVRADGSRFWAAVTIAAVRDGQGELTGFTKVTRDMTERRERRQELRRERTLTERLLKTAPVGLAVFRPDGSLERANSVARRRLGLEESELPGVDVEHLDVADADGTPILEGDHPIRRVLDTGEPVSGQARPARRTGREPSVGVTHRHGSV